MWSNRISVVVVAYDYAAISVVPIVMLGLAEDEKNQGALVVFAKVPAAIFGWIFGNGAEVACDPGLMGWSVFVWMTT